MPSHVITFHRDGTFSTLYTDKIDLRQLGTLDIKRASSIEFNHESQEWEVRFIERPINREAARSRPSGMEPPVAFSHPSREKCLEWEHQQLNQ